jgi:hypothetical protein
MKDKSTKAVSLLVVDFEDQEDVEEGPMQSVPYCPPLGLDPGKVYPAVCGVAATTTSTSVAGSGDIISLHDQHGGSAADGNRCDDAWPWKFLATELPEEEKVEEGAAGGDRK